MSRSIYPQFAMLELFGAAMSQSTRSENIIIPDAFDVNLQTNFQFVLFRQKSVTKFIKKKQSRFTTIHCF